MSRLRAQPTPTPRFGELGFTAGKPGTIAGVAAVNREWSAGAAHAAFDPRQNRL